jgi:hypothetical protein
MAGFSGSRPPRLAHQEERLRTLLPADGYAHQPGHLDEPGLYEHLGHPVGGLPVDVQVHRVAIGVLKTYALSVADLEREQEVASWGEYALELGRYVRQLSLRGVHEGVPG